MDERDEPIEFGPGTAVAVLTGPVGARVVVVLHVDQEDPAGTFRVRRGPTAEQAYAAPVELVKPPAAADTLMWADLADTGLQVKINAVRPALRIGVRRLEDVSD